MKRFVVVMTVWAMGLAGVLASVVFPSSASAASTKAGAYVSVTPSRLLNSLTGVGMAKAAIAARGTVHLKVTGRGGIPATGVSAVVLNVAVVAPTSSGYITVHAGGTARPNASNLNFVKGQTVPNLVIAPVGAGGIVDLHNGSAGTVKLVADVSGYFVSGAPTYAGAYGSLAPSRLLNSLTGVGMAKAAVPARGTVHLKVTGRGGVPATGVSAVVLNVAVVAPTSSGYITAHAGGTARPNASNLNFVKGQTVPNLVIAPVGADGKVELHNGSTGTVRLVADVSGYFRSGGSTSSGAYGSLAPSRLLNSLTGVGMAKTAVPARGTVHLKVTGRGGVPATGVSAVVLNVAVVAPTSSGYITAHAGGTTRPNASNLNFVKGQTVPNLVIAPVGADGKVELHNGSTGTVKLVADVSGYYLGSRPVVTPPVPPVPPVPADTKAPAQVTGVNATVSLRSIGLAWTNPTDADFTGVTIVRKLGLIAPATVADGTLVTNTVKAATSFTDIGLATGTQYSYSLFAHDAANNHAAAAKASGKTTGTGPVTGLRADPVSSTLSSIALRWVNPTDAAFNGIMIRRALGATPPATPTSGALFTDLINEPVPYIVDIGLQAGTQYSYAFFAHDAANNYAAAANVTYTTVVGGAPTAAMSISPSLNPGGVATTNLTVGVSYAFDAKASSAVAGKTLASATVNYGDGTLVEPFTGDAFFWSLNHAYAAAGTYQVTLTVTDSAGVITPFVVPVTVSAAPTAAITATGNAQVGVPFSVALASTTPPGTAITSYVLDVFGPVGPDAQTTNHGGSIAPSSTMPTTQPLTFTSPGTYQVTFSVANDAGVSSVIDSIDVTVVGGAVTAVLSILDGASADTTTSLVGEELFFDAAQSNVGANAVSVVLAYGDGETLSFDPAGDQNNWSALHAYATAGEKTVTLTVTPASGPAVVKTVQVIVSPVVVP